MKKYVFTLLVPALFVLQACSQKPKANNEGELTILDVSDFSKKLSDEEGIQLVDVRTAEEFAGGHIENAQNMNFYDEDFAEQVKKLDPGKPVMVYCQAGGRSAKAAEKFRQAGFKEVYDLRGGMLAWKKEQLPTSSPPAEDFFIKDFDDLLTQHELVVIDFYAPWCGPCRRIEPVLEEVSREFEGKVHYVRINVDRMESELAAALEIESIPVVAAYSKGKEVNRLVGDGHNKDDFRELFMMKP